MTNSVELSENLRHRIDEIVARSTLTRRQIVEDALIHGRSLAWQEKWITHVQAGIDAADRGEFASKDEIEAVLNKYNRS